MCRSIKISQGPFESREVANKFHSDMVLGLINDSAFKQVTIPYSDDTTRVTNRRSESMIVKSLRTKFSNEHVVKKFSLGLLETHNATISLIYFLLNFITYFL